MLCGCVYYTSSDSDPHRPSIAQLEERGIVMGDLSHKTYLPRSPVQSRFEGFLFALLEGGMRA